MRPKICEKCGLAFAPRYRVTAEYWKTRRFCSAPCAAAASRGRHNSSIGVQRVSLKKRFWSKVQKSGGCWLWLGALDGKGYGYLAGTRGLPAVKAHRVSYEWHSGEPIPPGIFVCHVCDNPPCVNPEHLFLGTNADNMRDMVSKGRQACHEGALNPNVKLTEQQLDVMLELRRGGMVQTEIASRFGVSQSAVSAILSGRAWASRLK